MIPALLYGSRTTQARELVIEYLSAIASLSRFSTVRLFLNGKDREMLKEIWDQVGGQDGERDKWGV
jgi:hypothetical protein